MNSQDRDMNTIGTRIRGWFDVVGNGTAASILAVGVFFAAIAFIAYLSGNASVLAVAVGVSIPTFYFLAHQILQNEARAKSDEALLKLNLKVMGVLEEQAKSTADIAKLTSEPSDNGASLGSIVLEGTAKDRAD